jgi:hypothetical protein
MQMVWAISSPTEAQKYAYYKPRIGSILECGTQNFRVRWLGKWWPSNLNMSRCGSGSVLGGSVCCWSRFGDREHTFYEAMARKIHLPLKPGIVERMNDHSRE